MRMRKEERWVLAIMISAAVILLLFFGRSSPLYPTNSSGEANVFFTVGRGMLEGKVPYVGYPKEELTQVKFAKYIEEQGGGSLLTYRMADEGFYLAAGEEPQWRAFEDGGDGYRGDIRNEQYNLVDLGEAEWIVSTSQYNPSDMYTQVQMDVSHYDDTSVSGIGRVYFLYHRIGK